MATNEAKTGPDTEALFTQLAEPFGPSEIKWRVTHTSHDGTRGAVIAFADPRAYTDRLNQLFTPSGWTRNYDVTTVSAVSRQKRYWTEIFVQDLTLLGGRGENGGSTHSNSRDDSRRSPGGSGYQRQGMDEQYADEALDPSEIPF